MSTITIREHEQRTAYNFGNKTPYPAYGTLPRQRQRQHQLEDLHFSLQYTSGETPAFSKHGCARPVLCFFLLCTKTTEIVLTDSAHGCKCYGLQLTTSSKHVSYNNGGMMFARVVMLRRSAVRAFTHDLKLSYGSTPFPCALIFHRHAICSFRQWCL